MKQEEVIKLLKEFNKWRRGKGKKYSQPGLPLNPTEIGEAIDFAIEHLSYRISPSQFGELYAAAVATEERIKTYIKSAKKGKIKPVEDMPVESAESRLAILKDALAASKKVINRINRRAKVSK